MNWKSTALGASLALGSLFGITISAMGCSSDTAGAEDASTKFGYPVGPQMRPGENCLGCHQPDFGDPAPTWSAGGTIFPTGKSARSEGLAGATIILEDEDGKEVVMTSNAAGNFYTAEPLKGSMRVRVEYQGKSVEMPQRAPSGACNACHDNTATKIALGHIHPSSIDGAGPDMQPGVACASCHMDGGIAPNLQIGGTVLKTKTSASSDGVEGAILKITDSQGIAAEFVTSKSGNFYYFPALLNGDPVKSKVDAKGAPIEGKLGDMVPPFDVELTYNGKTKTMPDKATSGDCNSCHSASGSAGAPISVE